MEKGTMVTIRKVKKLRIFVQNEASTQGQMSDSGKVITPSHLVWPDTGGDEVGVSSSRVYGVLFKVFADVFGCRLWK